MRISPSSAARRAGRLSAKALGLLLSAGLMPAAAETGGPAPREGVCRPDPSGVCTCSFGDVEVAMRFGDAASLILALHRSRPDRSYSEVLHGMAVQCLAAGPDEAGKGGEAVAPVSLPIP